MSDGSSIEWCDATWQPVLGCTRISAGCDHCYAINVVHRGMSPQHRGLTKVRPKGASRPGPDWNGEVRLQPEKLAEPLRWRKPRRVFVCSLADLFHERVPFEYVAAVFGVMAATPQHTYLVLTKRPERAREFFAWLTGHASRRGEGPRYSVVLHAQSTIGDTYIERGVLWRGEWPLPNVHLGTSVEDQATADERIPALLQCPAALHWVSAEPLLGPVYLAKRMVAGDTTLMNAMYHLGWVVVGGESGPGARPFDVAWARSLIEQARGLPTRVFVKQLGAKPIESCSRCGGRGIHAPGGGLDPDWCAECSGGTPWALDPRDSKGGDMSEWPADLRVREMPEVGR